MGIRRPMAFLVLLAASLGGPRVAAGQDEPPGEIRESFLYAYDELYRACQVQNEPAAAFRHWKTGLVYPVTRFAQGNLRVDHDSLFGTSARAAEEKFRDGQIAQKTFPPVIPFSPAGGITTFVLDAQPCAQTIRWDWSRKILELLAQEAGRPAAEWDQLAPSGFGIEMELVATGRDGKALRIPLPGYAGEVKNGGGSARSSSSARRPAAARASR